MKPVTLRGIWAAVLVFAAVAVLPIAAHAESQLKPKALVIMLDGFRGDALENLGMTNLQRLVAGKWQPGYKCVVARREHDSRRHD